MKKENIKVSLVALALLSPALRAEVVSIKMTDTSSNQKELPISNQYFNASSNIIMMVSAGLDRKLKLEVTSSAGLSVYTSTSSVIGVNDRITALSKDYYGKSFTLNKLNDGKYTVKASILNLSSSVIQVDEYPIVIDTQAPTAGAPKIKSYGGTTSVDTPANIWYTGYYHSNNYYSENIDDENSGVAQVNVIITKGDEVVKHSVAPYDTQTKTSYIGTGSGWFPSGDNAETVFGLQFEVIDKAGNIGYSSKQLTYYDTVGGSGELIGVYDPDSTSKMGGQTGYVKYVPGMEVKTNPIRIMYRIPKSNYSDYSRGGIYPVGATQTFLDIDNEYVYTIFTRPIGFTDGNYVRFSDRRTWSTSGISYNLKLAPSAPLAPKRKSVEYLYSDKGWGSWNRHVEQYELPIHVRAARGIVEARPYEQKFEHMGSCIIPIGDTECTITYSSPKQLASNSFGNLHSSSTFKNLDGSLYSSPGWAYVEWNGSELPQILDTEFDESAKKVTVHAYQPNDGYFFDSIRIVDAYLESNGEQIDAKRTKWQHNDNNYTFEFDLSPLPEGEYNIEAVIRENHENFTRAGIGHFVNDSTPPNITILYKGEPIKSMIQGISGLSVIATDASEVSLLDAQLTGGPAEDSVYLAYSEKSKGTWALEQPRIFPALTEEEKYGLKIRVKDKYDNIATMQVSFQYTPDNWIKLEGLKTLPVKANLLFRNDRPVALVTSSELRTDSGNLATGLQSATVTIRVDAKYPVIIENTIFNPGDTKVIDFDLGTQGGKLNIPVYPAADGINGSADFMIEVPQLKSIYDN